MGAEQHRFNETFEEHGRRLAAQQREAMSRAQELPSQIRMNMNSGLTNDFITNTINKNSNNLTAAIGCSEKKSMFKLLREYVQENKNLIFNVGLVVLLDHFVLGGAFRKRIEGLISGVLEKAEKQLKSSNVSAGETAPPLSQPSSKEA